MAQLVIIILISLLGIFGCSDPKPPGAMDDGHIVGNGGDHLEIYFAHGQSLAIRILQRLSGDRDLAAYSGISARATKPNLEKLQKIAPQLIFELKNSYHGLIAKLPQECPKHKCGCTLPGRPHEILVSYESCRSVSSRREAASNLQHEAVHLVLGEDEIAAQTFTGLVFDLWDRWGHSEAPHWVEVATPKEVGLTNIQRFPTFFADGRLIVAGDEELSFLDLATLKWEVNKTHNQATSQFSFYPENEPPNEAYWINGHLVSYGRCWNETDKSPGLVLSSDTRVWKALPVADAPSSRFGYIEQPTDKGLFVWGGRTCELRSRNLSDGAIYYPGRGWEIINPVGAPKTIEWGMSAVWWEKEVILWIFDRAFAYHLENRTWRALATKNQLSPRYRPLIRKMGDAILFYGGHKSEERSRYLPVALIPTGKLYFPKTDSWAEFNAPLPVSLRDVVYYWEDGIHWFDPIKRAWAMVAGSEKENMFLPDLFWTGAEYLAADNDIVDHKFKVKLFYP